MKYKTALSMISTGLLLSACSNDYSPPQETDGQQMFQAACSECHEPLPDQPIDMFYELSQENANIAYVSKKITNGGFTMPKFPNIKGDKLKQLSQYVLDHSVRK